jgi:hypothetical protein
VADVQITIRLGREACDDTGQCHSLSVNPTRIFTAALVGFNNAAQEVGRRDWRTVAAVMTHG